MRKKEQDILVGLVDADLLDNGTRHPNLALLKIAGFLKDNGINRELILDSKADISEEEFAKMKSITIDSALNKPDSLPVPILNSIITEAINDKKWSDEDANIYNGLDQKQRKNFVNFISKEAYATMAEIAVSHKAEIAENKKRKT